MVTLCRISTACFIIHSLGSKKRQPALIKDQSSVAEDEHDGLLKLMVCTHQKNIATLCNIIVVVMLHVVCVVMLLSIV